MLCGLSDTPTFFSSLLPTTALNMKGKQQKYDTASEIL